MVNERNKNFVTSLIFVFFWNTFAFSIINQTINYQGFLIDKNTNLPVDGSKDIKFAIYDFSTGGDLLFVENRCKVPVHKGRYDVEIGSVTSGGIPASVFLDHTNVWLQIEIDPDNNCSGTYDVLTPRIKMQTSPYAFNSLYASTASAATTHFTVDTIDAYPSTTYGAVTVSSNLFVMGGISVGSISPGQKLSVAGIVESSTGGFKFPDGSIQLKAAAETKWEVNGEDMYSINLGNIGISTSVPKAKLHISTGAGETGNVMIISTGSSDIFRINGKGEVYGNYFYGDGRNLTNVYGTDITKVSKNGDIINGFLEVSQGSVTILGDTSYQNSLVITTDTNKNVYHFVVSTMGYIGIGQKIPKYLLEISSINASGVLLAVSTGITGNIFQVSGNGDVYGKKFIGDGSGITNLYGYMSKSGDTMQGHLTVIGSSLTVINTNTADRYSIAITTDLTRNVYHFYVSTSGKIGIGTDNLTHKLTVNGSGIFSSSLTVNGGVYTNMISGDSLNLTQSITASSGTFWAFGNNYSIITTSGIKILNYGVEAPYFMGDGSRLTNVTGTDPSKLLKTGDIMTGNLEIRGSSLTISSYSDSFIYAMTVSSSVTSNLYSMVVTTAGKSGFKVNNPQATVHIYRDLMIGSDIGSIVDADLYIRGNNAYLNFGENVSGWYKKAKLGFLAGTRDMVYYSFPSDASSGIEVLKIYSNGQVNFSNMVTVSTSSIPMLYISSVTGSISISTNVTSNKLTVNGNIVSFSSITAYEGYYGDSSGRLDLNANNIYIKGNNIYSNANFSINGSNGFGLHPKMEIIEDSDSNERFILAIGSNPVYPGPTYDVVITTTGRLGIGLSNSALEPTDFLQVKGSIRIGESNDANYQYAYLDLNPIGGNTYINFRNAAKPILFSLGSDNTSEIFLFKTNTNNLSGGNEIYRIYRTGRIGIHYTSPEATLHIGSDLLVSTANVSPILFISTTTGSVGIGLTNPSSKLHIKGSVVVTSSISISGEGLSNNAIAFQIMNDTMTVLKNGNIGIGILNPSQRLEINGGMRLNTTDAKPTCDATTRGTFWITQGNSGEKDNVEVCAKDSTDTYAWRTIY